MMKIPEKINAVLEQLNAAGYEAYIVGGCVRDMVMGREPSDYDVTTSAAPEQTIEVFSGRKTLLHGMKHGTVTVMWDGEPVEITTFRRDGGYSDSRHPDEVFFDATLEQDLARRDFTCNAMAYSPQRGLADIFGGREDIAAGVICAVGDPEQRFREDALRILRAVRFASVLGFEIDEQTAEAAVKCAPLMDAVSGERLYVELVKLLCGKNAREVIMKYPEIIDRVVPGVLRMKDFDQNNSYHVYTLLEHTARVVEGVPDVPYMRLAALMHDIGKPDCMTTDDKGVSHFHGHPERSIEIAQGVLDRLKCDNETRRKTLKVIENHDVRFKPEQGMMLRWLGKIGEDGMNDAFTIQHSDISAQNPDKLYRLDDLEKCREIVNEAIEKKKCCTVAGLAIGGDDLIKMGMAQGEKVGQMLETLLECVIDGRLPNDRDTLIAFAVNNMK